MRLPKVARWILVVPSAVVAGYFAFVGSIVLYGLIVAPCMSSDSPQPAFCEAEWFPLEVLKHGVVLFGAGLSAALVVVVSALMAPSRRTTVAWFAVAIGAVVASWMGYRAGAVVEAAVAAVCGIIAAVFVSRHHQSSDRKIARSNAVPNA
jgi:uncharacterized membrane protein YadS